MTAILFGWLFRRKCNFDDPPGYYSLGYGSILVGDHHYFQALLEKLSSSRTMDATLADSRSVILGYLDHP